MAGRCGYAAPVSPRAAPSSLLLLLGALAAAGTSVVQAAGSPVPPPVEAAAVDAAIERASALLADGRAADAYALLAPLEPQRAGDAEFDYLLALAALDGGRAAAALAPLRRILAVEPRFDGARLELARALRAVGDLEGAQREYQWVLQQSASAPSRSVAARALAALRGAAPPRRTGWRGAVVAGAGYDTNANASASEAVFGFVLDPRAIQQSSAFGEIGGTLRGEFAPQRRVGLVAQLRVGHRSNIDAHFVDQSVAEASLGLSARRGEWTGGIGASLGAGWLDGAAWFGTGWLEASLSRALGARWELVGVGRAIALDYRQARFEPLDVRRYVWGAALQRRERAGERARLGIALLGGRDAVRDPASPWSSDRWGARAYAAWSLGARRAAYAEVSWLTGDYFGARGFFGLDRLDRQIVAAGGLELRDWPAPGWRVTPQLRWTENDSNVTPFRFDRLEASVFVRREFAAP